MLFKYDGIDLASANPLNPFFNCILLDSLVVPSHFSARETQQMTVSLQQGKRY